jgi:hypothetical protein
VQSTGADSLVLQAVQFQKIGVCCELPDWAGISHYRPNESFGKGTDMNRRYKGLGDDRFYV